MLNSSQMCIEEFVLYHCSGSLAQFGGFAGVISTALHEQATMDQSTKMVMMMRGDWRRMGVERGPG